MADKLTSEKIEEIFTELKNNPLNNVSTILFSNPKWASVTLGIFLCMDCAGQHRNLGVQYTFVRSLNLDTWTRKQITYMLKGGNDKAQKYFSKNGLEIKNISDYTSGISLRYKEELNKVVEKELKLTIVEQQKVVEVKQNYNETKPEKPKEQSPKMVVEPTQKPIFQDNLKDNQIASQPSVPKPSSIPLKTMAYKNPYSQQKGKVTAKKIQKDFDFNQMSIADKEKAITPSDQTQIPERKTIRKTSSSLELSNSDSNTQSISSKQFQPVYMAEETKQQYSKFDGQTSLSSAQMFGESLQSSNNQQEGNLLGQYVQFDQIMDFASTNLQKLKQQAGNAVERLKQWKNQA